MNKMSTFLIKWEIDIEANTSEEAARQALDIQRDINSTALVFEVERLATNEIELIDLQDDKKEI